MKEVCVKNCKIEESRYSRLRWVKRSHLCELGDDIALNRKALVIGDMQVQNLLSHNYTQSGENGGVHKCISLETKTTPSKV